MCFFVIQNHRGYLDVDRRVEHLLGARVRNHSARLLLFNLRTEVNSGHAHNIKRP